MTTPRPVTERVWRLVQRKGPDECWPWLGGKNHGYGVISRGAKGQGMTGAHRAVYESVNGPIPESMVVRHSCDNTWCCNPDHLSLGTHSENMRDMAERERSRTTRLTAQQVAQIRAARGMTYRQLGALYGVRDTTIGMILRGETWKHVKPAATFALLLEGGPDDRPVVVLDPMTRGAA